MSREQYEVHWKDYYEILQVHPRAEAEIVAAAYRKLAQLYHPDRNNDPSATRRFQQISEAYEVLSDPERRVAYDHVYSAQVNVSAPPSPAYRTDTHEPFRAAEQERWPEEQGPARPSSYDERPRYYEQPSEESDEQSIRSSPSSFISGLVERLAPDPDENQRLLPWPSWKWQRLALVGATPLSLLGILIGATQGAWSLAAISALLMAGALYAGIGTGWLRNTREAPRAAKVTGGACVAVSGVSYALGVAYVVIMIVILVLMLMLMFAAAKGMLEGTLKKS